jgi:uncharacterized protein YcfL
LKKIILLIFTLTFVLQTGCGGNEEMAEEESQTIPLEVAGEDNSILERSETISDYVVELYGIDDASSIIFNQKALIAVAMSYDVELNDQTKDLIKSVIMEKDKDLVGVLVTDDEKIFSGVNDIVIDLMSGTPYDTQVDAINRLIETEDKHK